MRPFRACFQILPLVAAALWLCSAPALGQEAAAGDDTPAWESGEEGPPSHAPASPQPMPSFEAVDQLEGGSSNARASVPLDLDARLAALDGYLEDIDKPTRRYFYTWLGVQSALTVGQVVIAFTADDTPTRGTYFIGSAVSATSLGLILLERRPGMGASQRFRDLPSNSESDKEAKRLAGEEALAGQAKAERRGRSWLKHALGIGAAVGSGALVAFLYDHSLKLATQRVFATFFVAELQILTRPDRASRHEEQYAGQGQGIRDLSFSPMVDRHAQGIALCGRF
jgi:hypothetical protein